jgi:hypothetical protein
VADRDLMTMDPTTAPYVRDIRAGDALAGSTRDETFRGVMQVRTPDGEIATVIITRQGLGAAARIWLTFNGATKTTVVMTNGETGTIRELLDKATLSGGITRKNTPDAATRSAKSAATGSPAPATRAIAYRRTQPETRP